MMSRTFTSQKGMCATSSKLSSQVRGGFTVSRVPTVINSTRRQEAANKRLKKVPSIDDASNQETGVLLAKSPDAINEAKEQVGLNNLNVHNIVVVCKLKKFLYPSNFP